MDRGDHSGSHLDEHQRDADEALRTGSRQKRLRRVWRSIPSAPRCKTCHRPFAGVGGPIMRIVGLGPWPANPKYCRGCYRALYRQRTGAEVECSLLFADVRDSTGLAETMPPGAFRLLMDRFYATAFAVLVAHDAFVDKFVGDEVIGIFIPAMTDGHHARDAVEAGLELIGSMRGRRGEAAIPVGVGVNTGVAYVGAVGTDEHVEFTALGDVVNVTARLASAAGAGELIATDASMMAANMPTDRLERRRLQLKGKADPVDVVVVNALSGAR